MTDLRDSLVIGSSIIEIPAANFHWKTMTSSVSSLTGELRLSQLIPLWRVTSRLTTVSRKVNLSSDH